jgi:rSAM/selenodomain-associated transferase 1
MDKHSENILIVFAKYPVPGQVKTRLSKSIGVFKACNIYKCFVPVVIERTRSEKYSTVVFFTPQEKLAQMKTWLGNKYDYIPQSKGSLGTRLKQAFKQMFLAGAKKVVVIGSDSPLLENQIIEQAFAELDEHDCVIGPSSDGGYYLLGAKRNIPELFDITEWSTNVVFQKTMQQVEKQRLKAKVLAEHFDIDEKEDLNLLFKKLGGKNNPETESLKRLKQELKNLNI